MRYNIFSILILLSLISCNSIDVKRTESQTASHKDDYLKIPINDVDNCYVIWFSSGKEFSPKTNDELIAKLNSFLVRKVSCDQALFKKRGSNISAWLIVADVFQKNEIKKVLKREKTLSGPQVEKLDSRFYDLFKSRKMANKKR